MKIKKIGAACRERGVCVLYDRIDGDGCVEQWIGNGAAMYPVRGLPYLEPDNLVTIFELTVDQAEKMVMRKSGAPATIDLRDAAPDERAVKTVGCTIRYGGRDILPVKDVDGAICFIDAQLLAPAEVKDGEPELWARRSPDGMPYFAVKRGLMLSAVVMPLDHMDSLADLLGEIAAGYRDSSEN